MRFKHSMRYNSETQDSCGYRRLVESYRNYDGRSCQRTLLNVGFVGHILPEQMNKIQKQLTLRAERKIDLFQDQDPMVMEYAEKYGSELVDRKKVDISKNTEKKQGRLVDVETIKHENVREIGAEWLSYQALEQLKVAEFLKGLGWEEEVISLALTQIISRAVYPNFEPAVGFKKTLPSVKSPIIQWKK